MSYKFLGLVMQFWRAGSTCAVTRIAPVAKSLVGRDEMRELVKIPVFGRKSTISLSGTRRISVAILLSVFPIKRHVLIRDASVDFRFESRELAHLSILLVHC
jgi:hypothetical protein